MDYLATKRSKLGHLLDPESIQPPALVKRRGPRGA
jgi:hypothetical protein